MISQHFTSCINRYTQPKRCADICRDLGRLLADMYRHFEEGFPHPGAERVGRQAETGQAKVNVEARGYEKNDLMLCCQ